MPAKRKPAPEVDPEFRRTTRSTLRALETEVINEASSRPDSRASNTSSSTVVPSTSTGSPGVISVNDTSSTSEDEAFAAGVNLTSTALLRLPNTAAFRTALPTDHSVSEFDTAVESIMSDHENEDIHPSDGLRTTGENALRPPANLGTAATQDPMLLIAQMMQSMQAAREADQRRYEQEQRWREQEQRRREDEQRRREDEQRRRDEERQERLEERLAELARRSTSRPSLPKSSAKIPVFNLEKDKAVFYTWKEKWTAYITAHGLDKIEDDEERQQRIRAEFTTAMSDHTLRWISNQSFPPDDYDDAEFLIEAIENYIKGTTNPLVQNVELLMLKKRQEETVEFFVEKIKEKAKLCELDKVANPADYFPMLCLIAGHNDAQVRKKLMLAKVDTFAKAVEICEEEEKAAKSSKQFANGSGDAGATSGYKQQKKSEQRSSQGQYTRGGSHANRGNARGGSSQGGHQQDRGRSQARGQSQNRSQSQSREFTCHCCGRTGHKPKDPACRATGEKCKKCGKIGHFGNVCRSTSSTRSAAPATGRQQGQPDTGGSSALEVFVSSISASVAALQDDIPEPEKLELVQVQLTGPEGQQISVDALPDTGANISAIPASEATTFKWEKTNYILKGADHKLLNTKGVVRMGIHLRGKSAVDNVFIVKDLTRPILSRRVIKALGLIPPDFPRCTIHAVKSVNTEQKVTTGHGEALDRLVNEFPELFDGKCKVMNDGQYHIELEENATPVSTGACRTVPEPYMPALKKELDDLVSQGIIEKVDYPTPWLHPIVVVPKKGTTDIRLCVDFTKLNKFVKRPTNPQPTPWEVVRNLPKGTKHFAVFDALKGYHQVELDEESRDLTAFMTPFGRFVYLRLPFGMSSAGDVFTLKYGNAVDAATDGRRATEDTLIRGNTTLELLQNTRNFFEACRTAGITLNLRKIQWDQPEVLFGGFLLNEAGYRIDPSLTKALAEFPTPKNPTDVRSFFGLANQICNFSDEISQLCMPMKSLLKKGVMFQWLPEHQAAFDLAREHLASTKVLAYYDPTRQTRLVVDASRLNGLGFVLKQLQEDGNWKPVQAGSRFLTAAETRYAMIELEMLAIAWACQKARIFVEGLPRDRFEIWTDHAPLVPILEKQALPDIANKRLQRLKMKVEHLTFRTVWIKGEKNVEADSLSRHPCAKASPEDELDEEVHVAHVQLQEVNVLYAQDQDILDERLRELKSFCNEDHEYKQVTEMVIKGFPTDDTGLSENLRQYVKVQDELYLDSDNFLCYKKAFVVPAGLRQTYLERLLAMHQAAPKMIARARQSLWWPFMTRDIKNFAKTCETCERYKPSQSESLRQHQPATYAFQFLHMDIGEHMGKYYLFTVDQFSNYPGLADLGKTATAQQIIDATIEFISKFSVPEVIYSDGGPQFVENGKFDDFCKAWGIKHVTSSPYMSRSNGIAEECVKEMKKIVRANVSSSGVLDRASALSGLQMFRNTPRSPTDLSPNQIIFGHHVRDSLPARREDLIPQQRYEVERRLQEVREKQREAQEHAPKRELPILYPGQLVIVQDPVSKRWTRSGTVVNFGSNNREYMVKIDGRIYRRNRKFLKPQDVQPRPPLRQPVQAPNRTTVEQGAAANRDADTVGPRPTVGPEATGGPRTTVDTTTRGQTLPAPTPAIGRPKRAIRLPVRFQD